MYAVIRTFNNEKTIRECLLSFLPHVDKVVIIDGAYERFPHELESGASTDETKEICHRLCSPEQLIWVDPDKPLTEIAKNNLMLKYIPLGEWSLWIDADEIIEGDVAEAVRFAETSSFQSIGVQIKNFHPIWHGYKVKYKGSHPYVHLDPTIPEEEWDNLTWKPYYGVSSRFKRRTPNLRFKGHHHRLYIGKKLIQYEASLEDVMIVNNHEKVGWERWHQKIRYKKECYLKGEWR